MSKWIDADELRSFIKDRYFKCDMPEEWGNGVMWATSQINRYCNKEAPSIDIVRCKECKFRNVTEHGKTAIRRLLQMASVGIPDDDDFCSYGERKESE